MPTRNRPTKIYATFILSIFLLFLPSIQSKIDGQEVSFRNEIQPLLANHCFACHGPDEQARQADLRLDIEDAAKDWAIVPGKPLDSELISRIQSDDPEFIMPPPDHGEPLNAAERDLLARWIDQGAKWQDHWAFETIKQPAIPADESGWSTSPLDQFVRQRMLEHDLQPEKRATKRKLIRRVYLDLIGIPPTIEQVDQFVSGEIEFPAVVEQLLESPHYGEQMAVSWLDLARYADTNGYQNDFRRSMWIWRDWVITAFNQNQPIDDFIVEQLAGDLLPEPTLSQLVATGFNRNSPTVTEGGSIPEEWRIENAMDRTETTAATLLGLTMGCARCHDHKYDPVSQREFYEFFAFFNNIDERGVYQEKRGNTEPLIRVPTKEQISELHELDKLIEAKTTQLKISESSSVETILADWQMTVAEKSTTIPQSIWEPNPATQSETEDSSTVWSPAGKAIQFSGQGFGASNENQPEFEFRRDQAYSWVAWIQGETRGAVWGKMNENNRYRGVDTLILGDGRFKVHLINSWEPNSIAVESMVAIQPNQWNHVAVTYDGSSQASGVKIYLNGQVVAKKTIHDSLTGPIVTSTEFTLGMRGNASPLAGSMAQFRIYSSELTPDQIELNLKSEVISLLEQTETANSESPARTTALTYMRQAESRIPQIELANLKARRKRIVDSQPTTMIMRDRGGDYRPTWLLNRGQYDQPEKEVDLWPAIPEVLPALESDQPKNRLGLARWMVDERNPLVARVIVNRVWQKYFGQGLVTSADNFGVQGDPPSHPELLDWLADDFRRHGWDLKRLHRQIILSATYQQDSETSAEKLAKDPSNRWLSRGARYRLSAEQIRDSVLHVSGLLSDKTGGPSVYPYQPDGLWDELAGGANGGPYKQSIGSDLYRRSLYTYRKRTVPHPTTATFDAPSFEKCQIKRGRTNTPLQALALLNDITYVEAARNFAARILKEGGEGIEQQIDYAVQVVLSRPASALEKRKLKSSFDEYLVFYKTHPDEVTSLLSTGDSPCHQPDSAELAALTLIASVILNLDEAISRE